MRETRVLFYIAYPQRMAGANRSLFELITHLPSNIHPLVVVAGEGAVAAAYREAGVECSILPPPGLLSTFGRRVLAAGPLEKVRVAATGLLPYTLRLRRLIREWGADVVHVNDPRGAALAAPAARLAGRPVVAHLRGELPFGRLARYLFERSADRIVTVSEAVRQTLSPAGRRKAVTVYNGVREIRPLPGRLPWIESLRARGVVVVGCFASVVPFKGHHHLLHATAELNRRGWRDRVVVLCVGDIVPEQRQYFDWLGREADALGVDNLVFAGWQDDPFQFYRHADLTVLPSVSEEMLEIDGETRRVLGNEGLPRTHLEAMRLGLPIVGTAIAGVPEQVEHGMNGLIVPPSDPMALADALEMLVSDAELRVRFGEAGRFFAEERFSTASYVHGVVDVYRGLVPRLFAEGRPFGGRQVHPKGQTRS